MSSVTGEATNPGLLFCWICGSWLEGEPGHLEDCHTRPFAALPRPLTFNACTLRGPLPGSSRAETYGLVRIPFLDVGGIRDERQAWLRESFAALVEQVGAGRTKPRKGKSLLVRSITHTCPASDCLDAMQGLTPIIVLTSIVSRSSSDKVGLSVTVANQTTRFTRI